jgi:uncharacterized alkaline shock family protein YloU
MTETEGAIRIAPEVLAMIVNLTAMSVPGIVAMASVPRSRLLDRLQPDATRGVHITVRDKAVYADLYVVVAQGTNMVEVGNRVQLAVAQAIHEMLGMSVRTINVYIQGIE